MNFRFECVISSDLNKEDTLYSGLSAGKALETAVVADRVLTNSEGTAVVRINRIKGKQRETLVSNVYEEGEVTKVEDLFTRASWFRI